MSPNDSIDNSAPLGHRNGDESPAPIGETPGHQQSAFEQAAAAIVSGKGAGTGEATSFGIEIANLENWARQTQRLIPEEVVDQLQPLSNTEQSSLG